MSSGSSGIGFFGLLTLVFIALKLTDNIMWTWFWVLSPITIPICIILFIICVIIVCYVLKELIGLSDY